MNDHDIATAFSNITSSADGSRTANMVRMRINASEKQRNVMFGRKCLIAACLVFLLILTVGAYTIHRSLSIKVPDAGPFDYVMEVKLDEEQTDSHSEEMLTLSDAIIAELENYRYDVSSGKSIYDVGRIFDSWEEAAHWLNCGILTSEMLGDIPENVTWGGEIVLISIYSSDGELRCVQLTGTNAIIGKDASCMTTVIIPLSGEWEQYGAAASFDARINEDGVLELPEGQPSDSMRVSSFTTACGNQAQIAVVKSRNVYNATGYFVENSIIYSFSVSHEEETTATDLVKQIIESINSP